MKPIVVSAAAAPRTPTALPNASAALPCNKCLLEILPKSIACSPPAVPPPVLVAAARDGGAVEGVASFMPEHVWRSWQRKYLNKKENGLRGETEQSWLGT